MKKETKISLIVSGSVIFLMFMFYLLFLNHTSINEIGIAYNSSNGEITIQKEPGWYITGPLVRVAYVSTLPTRVEIPSQANVVVAKMVVFKPEGVKEFIRIQGFSYTINTSYKNIMLGYAFSGNDYPFMEIIQETTKENTDNLRKININE